MSIELTFTSYCLRFHLWFLSSPILGKCTLCWLHAHLYCLQPWHQLRKTLRCSHVGTRLWLLSSPKLVETPHRQRFPLFYVSAADQVRFHKKPPTAFWPMTISPCLGLFRGKIAQSEGLGPEPHWGGWSKNRVQRALPSDWRYVDEKKTVKPFSLNLPTSFETLETMCLLYWAQVFYPLEQCLSGHQ